MKKIIALLTIVASILIAVPQNVFAQNTNTSSTTNTNTSPANTNTSSSSTKNDFGLSQTTNVNLPNTSPDIFVATIIRWVLGLLGLLLVGLFVYGGFLYATAAGNEQQAENAKRVLTYAIIGTVIIVAAGLISEFVINALFAPPSSDPLTSSTSSSASSSGTGSSTTNNSGTGDTTGNSVTNSTRSDSSGSGTRLPPTQNTPTSGLCTPGVTQCQAGLSCVKDPNSSQSFCLIPKGKPCNTNTAAVFGGGNGCEWGSTCVATSNPQDSIGLPDPSQNNGVCR